MTLKTFLFAASITLGIQPALANPYGEDMGVRVEINLKIGQIHSEESRFASHFALSKARDIQRYSQPILKSQENNLVHRYESEEVLLSSYYQNQTPFAFALSWESKGNFDGRLFGASVAQRNIVMNANGAPEAKTFWGNPWTWVGAAAIGVAAAAGGGSGGGSDDGPSNNTNVVNGVDNSNQEECTIAGGDDDGNFSVVTGGCTSGNI